MDLSLSELVIVGVIAFLVFGPEEFVRKMGQFGNFMGKLRTQAENFKVMAHEQVMKKVDPLATGADSPPKAAKEYVVIEDAEYESVEKKKKLDSDRDQDDGN